MSSIVSTIQNSSVMQSQNSPFRPSQKTSSFVNLKLNRQDKKNIEPVNLKLNRQDKKNVEPVNLSAVSDVKNKDDKTVVQNLATQQKNDLNLRILDNALRPINLRLNLSDNNKMDVRSEDFQKKLFDAAFNIGRRIPFTIGDKRLNNWRNEYDHNYALIENEMQKWREKPEEEQKNLYNSLRLGAVLSPLKEEDYGHQLSQIVAGKASATDFLEKQLPVVNQLVTNAQDTNRFPKWDKCKMLMDLGIITDKHAVSYLGDKLTVKDKEAFEKKVDELYTVTKTAPEKPRVLVFWNGREGKIGDLENHETSIENAELTSKLREYWRQKGFDTFVVDGSGGNRTKNLDIQTLVKMLQPSGFITGGGPDLNPYDPFVKNLANMVGLADKKNMPYFGECLGHQLLGMIKSGEGDYKNYVGRLKKRASHSPHDISVIDTKDMENTYNLYLPPLSDLLKKFEAKRFAGQDVPPVQSFCIHNNIVNEEKPLAPRTKVVAYSSDENKSPEILARFDDNGKYHVISTQFHPSKLTAQDIPDGLNANDEDFGLTILDTSISDMKDYHRKSYLK